MVWDLQTSFSPPGSIDEVEFSPGGSWLIVQYSTGSKSSAQDNYALYDVANGFAEVDTISNSEDVSAFGWESDTRCFLIDSGFTAGTVHDVSSSGFTAVTSLPDKGSREMAFARDGTHILMSDGTDTIEKVEYDTGTTVDSLTDTDSPYNLVLDSSGSYVMYTLSSVDETVVADVSTMSEQDRLSVYPSNNIDSYQDSSATWVIDERPDGTTGLIKTELSGGTLSLTTLVGGVVTVDFSMSRLDEYITYTDATDTVDAYDVAAGTSSTIVSRFVLEHALSNDGRYFAVETSDATTVEIRDTPVTDAPNVTDDTASPTPVSFSPQQTSELLTVTEVASSTPIVVTPIQTVEQTTAIDNGVESTFNFTQQPGVGTGTSTVGSATTSITAATSTATGEGLWEPTATPVSFSFDQRSTVEDSIADSQGQTTSLAFTAVPTTDDGISDSIATTTTSSFSVQTVSETGEAELESVVASFGCLSGVGGVEAISSETVQAQTFPLTPIQADESGLADETTSPVPFTMTTPTADSYIPRWSEEGVNFVVLDTSGANSFSSR